MMVAVTRRLRQPVGLADPFEAVDRSDTNEGGVLAEPWQDAMAGRRGREPVGDLVVHPRERRGERDGFDGGDGELHLMRAFIRSRAEVRASLGFFLPMRIDWTSSARTFSIWENWG